MITRWRFSVCILCFTFWNFKLILLCSAGVLQYKSNNYCAALRPWQTSSTFASTFIRFCWNSILNVFARALNMFNMFARAFKSWPNAFNISFNIVQHCCMQHVERVWLPMLNDVERWMMLNVEWCWTCSIFCSTCVQLLYWSCRWWNMSNAFGHPWLQHRSTLFNNVERCWTKCWKRFAKALCRGL